MFTCIPYISVYKLSSEHDQILCIFLPSTTSILLSPIGPSLARVLMPLTNFGHGAHNAIDCTCVLYRRDRVVVIFADSYLCYMWPGSLAYARATRTYLPPCNAARGPNLHRAFV